MSVKLIAESKPFDALRFRLYPNMLCDTEWCGITVDSLFANGENISDSMNADGTDLFVPLPNKLRGSRRLDVTAWFTTRVPNYADRFGYYNGRYALETWFPMPAPRRNGEWLKIEYNPDAEPVADYFDFDVTLRYPDTLQAISPGFVSLDTLGDTASCRWVLPDAHEFPVLLGSGFKLDSTMLGKTSVKIFYAPKYTFAVDSIRNSVTRTLTFMSDYVSPYPYDEMIAVVGVFPRGGLELPRMTWLLPVPEHIGYRPYATVVIHEVIHQWFYGMINTNQALDPWMDESVTEFFTVKVNREIAGPQGNFLSLAGFTTSVSAKNRYAGRDFIGLVPITWPTLQYTDREYFSTIYAKGMMVMQTLTRLMGPENEKAFWQDYARTWQLREPTPDDFYAIADKYLPHEESASAASIVEMTEPLDFEMVSIGRQELQSVDTSDTDSTAGSSVAYSSEVHYTARHPLGFPVTVRLLFDDDTTQDTSVVPVMGFNSIVVTREVPVKGAIIDPDFVYAVDMNYLNNSLIPDSGKGAGLRLFSGFMYLLELLFSGLWGI